MKRIITISAGLLVCVLALAGNIRGRVICDGRPVEGVPVSDGAAIVKTDASGRYDIASDKADGSVFIITPSGYIARTLDGLRPGFWQQLYLPADQEEIHDFVLEKQDQQRYTMLMLADIHLSNDPAREDLRRFREEVLPHICEQVAKASSAGPVYSINLGDTTHDVYWEELGFNESDGLRYLQDLPYPTPMYSIMGNHDHDPSIVGEDVDRRSGWRERDCWGPGAYSVNIGGDHWIFLDNIFYVNVKGKGKKAPGVAGDRSYKQILTDRQFDWLAADLALVDKDARIYICTHAPVFFTTAKDKLSMPKKQVDRIASLCEPFTHDVTILSGHIHRNDIIDHDDYPKLHQRSLPATSGIMWTTTVGWPLYSSEGSDAGIWVGEFEAGSAPRYRLETYLYGEKYCRFYDLNEVGKAYRESEGIKKQQELFPDTRLDYGQSKWRNYVFLNYWGWEPGDTVEMFEKSRRLKVEDTQYEDPTKNLAFELPRVMNPYKHSSKRSKDSTHHMYAAKTSSAKTPVTVRIFASDGRVKFERTYQRPRPFDPSKPETD
ncbi:MAG: calcineurin-like phosphoesterase C-terminal domain-containing protein [Bacteroidales bacterium]|nr:calcineurin-like phosphoesterase C-terminal domain-containing protein [Bacteroidales bacterium]